MRMSIGVTCTFHLDEGNVKSPQNNRLRFTSIGDIQRRFLMNINTFCANFHDSLCLSIPSHPEEFVSMTLTVAARISQ